MTSVSTRSGTRARAAQSAASPFSTASTCPPRREDVAGGSPHVAVVLDEQDVAGRALRRARVSALAGGSSGSSAGGPGPATHATLPPRTPGPSTAVDAELRARRRCAPRHVRVSGGMRTVNVLPRPTSLVAWTSPTVEADQLPHEREADAGALVAPPARALDPVEALEDPRELLGGIPTPVSRTSSARWSPHRQAQIAISPSNVNLNAFETRLRTIFSHISRST